jgi:hypothetical protein
MYYVQMCTYTFVLTSGAWHKVLSEFPHSTISLTLCIPLGLFPSLIREVCLQVIKKIYCFLL